ncbi:MAG: Hsp20/alpha crystallin family protein [Acidobacteria bacterium]|nr:Hsp20/alpha crystallin family protein [Acidobacteriota bacterium]
MRSSGNRNRRSCRPGPREPRKNQPKSKEDPNDELLELRPVSRIQRPPGAPEPRSRRGRPPGTRRGDEPRRLDSARRHRRGQGKAASHGGQFVRSFTLPNNVDRENVQAHFSDGLLRIEMPKREEAKPRQIRISGGEGQKRQNEPIDVKRG